ncbi:MAG: DNA-directed RNA polymerase subunit beta [Candidatus Latescibacterota bacterium]|nr:DNA-directed RNA polymerase subunit beta [Candidatus Latescibacterota bacterium]
MSEQATAQSGTNGKIERRSFGKIAEVVPMPNLLEVQIKSYGSFLQLDTPPSRRLRRGLHLVFESIYPIADTQGIYSLEYVDYSIGNPRYSVDECRERGMTFAAPLRATLRLVTRDKESPEKPVKDVVEQSVFLGELPLMTDQGTFVINGAERVVVSQLHRSPGVFFDETIHPNGKRLFSARILPSKGPWLEFSLDINDIMYVHIDRRRKLPVSLLLRAMGFSKPGEVMSLFRMEETADISEEILGRYLGSEDVVNKRTGEIVAEAYEEITEERLEALQASPFKKVSVIAGPEPNDPGILENTLKKDPSENEEDALTRIYNLLRPGDPPNIETARGLLDRLFFNPKRYNLGDVGRHRINRRLNLDIPAQSTVLHLEDFMSILRYLMELRMGQGFTDDIDHLGNRRVRLVGELLANQFSIGLTRMARTIRERMSLRDEDQVTPHDLVNARTVSTVVQAFFGSSQLSQFMQQNNPLDELTHKRRLSALGPGGLSRDRAGFEVRDVHYTHYGRICPIETPEGPNIGLISSLSTFARVNTFGFLETPYRKVVDGKVTDEIEFLSADVEDRYTIAQANELLKKEGRFVNNLVKARQRDDYPMITPEECQYMDVSPKQLVSAAAALIPFLEHDDANRALMGSNMQRQAVPLLFTQAPLVGTGMEHKVAVDSGAVILALNPGGVVEADSSRIVIRRDKRRSTQLSPLDAAEIDEYRLTKFARSNQDCCMNQRPIVKAGDTVRSGQVIADGPATESGDLALGMNVLCAFMPWNGYNFEDAIVISERLLKKDVFTSVHIEEFELQVRDTKRGQEEITREIPNVSELAVGNLDDEGIVRIGADVGPGDILVGKVTPKGETELSPEERLLRAIFGEKAGDVRDASLKAPPGMEGVVIGRKLFSRKDRGDSKKKEKEQIAEIGEEAERHKEALRRERDRQLLGLLSGRKLGRLRSKEDGSVVVREGTTISERLIERTDFTALEPEDGWTDEDGVNEKIDELLHYASEQIQLSDEQMERKIERLTRGDELPPGIIQLVKVYVAKKRKLSVGDKMAGRHGNKGVVATIVPEEDMPYLEDGTPVDIVLNPLGVPSRMNLGQIFETHLGWAAEALGVHVSTPVFDGATHDEVRGMLAEAGLPEDGKAVLYDGRSGQKLNKRVTVGNIYMLKLTHLVADKIHARSIGPYSLVTQQPLGGKAQFGGQRFGEMEVWALEAYGSAYTLQEMLTVKSDDVAGRSKIYEAIVKGENPPEPGIPESFNVLVKELQSLCLDVILEDSMAVEAY